MARCVMEDFLNLSVVNESRSRDRKFFEVKGFVSIWFIYYYYDYVDLKHFVGSMKIAFVIFLRLINR
jgi:hypothetical protein